MVKKVGIFSGSFDPVHKGHIAFALLAAEQAGLDMVYFLPEVKPRHKPSVSHISHRVAMLKLAVKPHTKLDVLELPDKQFSIASTLPRLYRKFNGDELFFLMGTDVADHLDDWSLADVFLKNSLIISTRDAAPKFGLPVQPKKLYILKSPEPKVSSSNIRKAAEKGRKADGSLDSVNNYIKRNWLYSAAPKNS